MKEKEMYLFFFKYKFVKVIFYLCCFGYCLSGMIMLNLSIFIVWSLLFLVVGYMIGNLWLVFFEVEMIMI